MLQEKLTDPEPSDARSDVSNLSLESQDARHVQVSIRRTRLAVLVAFAVSTIIAITIIFSRNGVVLDHFERATMSTNDQYKLVERYNSYSSNVASAIERPLELFLALASQLLVLRVFAHDLLTSEHCWSVKIYALFAGSALGYLLANGLNGLNVQTRELPIHAVISDGDLQSHWDTSRVSSTTDITFPETMANNPVANTILRNLILPRALQSKATCVEGGAMADQMDTVEFGIPQNTWLKNFLQEPPEIKSMRFEWTPTHQQVDEGLTPDDFPMPASAAADLLLYSRYESISPIWGSDTSLTSGGIAKKYYPTNNSLPLRSAETARLEGLLPPVHTGSENHDRLWFVHHIRPYNYSSNAEPELDLAIQRWSLTLSRVSIAPSVWLDAVTIETERTSPRLESARKKDGNESYYSASRVQAFPTIVAVPAANDSADAKIDMFAACRNADGSETLQSTLRANTSLLPAVNCTDKSPTSLIFMSSGRYLVADALIDDAIGNATGIFENEIRGVGLVVNLREVISTTTARLHWKLVNLSDVYDAVCDSDGGCMGLHTNLTGGREHLVVRGSALPASQAPIVLDDKVRLRYMAQQPLSIVAAKRTKSFKEARSGYSAPAWLGDLLLPHNIRELHVNTTRPDATCQYAQGNRVEAYVNNHVYMESTLQPTYTAVVQSGKKADGDEISIQELTLEPTGEVGS